jgi:hypothetical protein
MLSMTTQTSESLISIQESVSKPPGHNAASEIDHDIDQARNRIRASTVTA